ncbi:unnamed protein product [Didymodactylos carnosus]|uniref:Transmembrane protein 45B n=1 Tax=Didymodactylos carnosus TaxID=1234261 RepID=A0A814ANY7_9BILA|nr:unnamed protein product [Didymodactylos carnosus]CAF0914753.1 unnamed protein product [Didymodactylos carnosus]CAF3592740.1 unnamed protein product [Didymodactylos carnosus]CAF3695207.1 unnamed protein product [Didymodactylos carnosus]
MGSFPGHAIPGSIFIFLGLWWIYATWLRYFICRIQRKPFYITTSFPFHCCAVGLKLPLEAFIVLFGTTVGIAVELGAGLQRNVDQNGKSSFIFGANNLQHFAMYFMFFLVGILELLLHYRFPLPKHIDTVVGAIAFSAEGLLFYFHIHARDPVDVQLHILLVLAISATVISGVFEIIQSEPKQVYATLMRGYFTVLQGVWFYQTAFILYSPFHAHYDITTDPEQHRTLMLISYYFVLHMAAILIIVLLLALLANRVSKRYMTKTLDYEQILIDETTVDKNDNYNDEGPEYDENKTMTNGHMKEQIKSQNSLLLNS